MAAKAARFKVGSSGSGKHTEMVGGGGGMGGSASAPSVGGPKIGPGKFAGSVKADYDRNGTGNGQGKVGKMSRYSEE